MESIEETKPFLVERGTGKSNQVYLEFEVLSEGTPLHRSGIPLTNSQPIIWMNQRR